MKIGIVGAGFTGLAAGFKLAKGGHQVFFFEAGQESGGLATGFKERKWKWSLEQHYHHLFKTDYAIKTLADEINHEIVFKRPKTSTYYKGTISQIDSPINLLKFDAMSLPDRLRTGLVLAYLKTNNSWKSLEKISTEDFLIKTMGNSSWETLWKPLMEKKFGKYSKKIPASWFWARVKSRTATLGYPKKGFKEFANHLTSDIEKKGGTFFFNTKVEKIRKSKKKISIYTSNGETYDFDRVICTLPFYNFAKIATGLSNKYIKRINTFEGIGATNLILQLNKSFLEDGTYWLNINEKEFPFLCVVEHTNFMDSKNYNNKKILYIGNYLNNGHQYYSLSEKEVLNEYFQHLQKINPNFKKSWIEKVRLFKAPFAQPIITKNYSKKIPSLQTEIEGVYLANMQQVYPWDRGTNYAVELGDKVATKIINEK